MSFSQFQVYLMIGAVLLLIEVIGFTGFLIGIAIGALGAALATYLFPGLGVLPAALLFGSLSLLLTWVYWHYFRDFNSATDAPGLHRRAEAQVGKSFELVSAVDGNASGHFIGDTRWQVRTASNQSLAAGQRVVITAVNDAGELLIEAQDSVGG